MIFSKFNLAFTSATYHATDVRRKLLVVWVSFILLLIVVSINDFLFFRIENEYVLMMISLYGLSYLFGVSGNNFYEAFKISIAVFSISFVMNQFNLIGGGDVKFLFPLILFAENHWFEFIWGTAIGGIILAIAYICFRKEIFSLRMRIIKCLFDIKKKKSRVLRLILLSLFRIKKSSAMSEKCDIDPWKQEIPYGVALSCGGMLVVLDVMSR
ncbi:MAG: hypothetical protein E7015_02585 [Alphaproteobacteria bacterium]|nr:hypothetical protein [Alphaproteobacteria bacterium]